MIHSLCPLRKTFAPFAVKKYETAKNAEKNRKGRKVRNAVFIVFVASRNFLDFFCVFFLYIRFLFLTLQNQKIIKNGYPFFRAKREKITLYTDTILIYLL
jgi:hypothetical protein